MQTQVKVLQSKQSKGKSADRVGAATEEFQYLMYFSTSITQCLAKAMAHLSFFAFVSMANVTLISRNSYLDHVKSGLKKDTLAALNQAPLKRILVDLRTRVGPMDCPVARGTIDFTLTNGRTDKHRNRSLASQHGSNWDVSAKKVVDSQISFLHVRPGFSSHINDNYCESAPLYRRLT